MSLALDTAAAMPEPALDANNDLAMKLSPEVVARLQQLQDANRPVSLDEILQAANLSHLGANHPVPSKSADTRLAPDMPIVPTKSASMTLAERRRIPASTEKLRLYAQIAHQPHQDDPTLSCTLLDRLELDNEELPQEDADLDLLTHLERQQSLLAADPKSACIDCSALSAETARLTSDNDSTNDDDSFWKCLAENYTAVAPRIARLLISRLRQQGIAASWRSVLWQAMAQSSDTHLVSMYDRLVQGDMGSSSYERVIDRDVARMTDSNREATGRLLKAYSIYDAHVGYCQGLAMLARPLLMVMGEQQAFCTFVRLMEAHEMRALFMLNMEGLHLRLHQFQTLLSQQCPQLFQHLADNAIHPPMYASQWFLTLFASSLPSSVALRMYDLVFAQGAIPTMMRVAIAVMQKHQDRLLNICQFEQLMTYLTSGTLYEDDGDLVAAVLDLTPIITTAKMDSIAETYQKEVQQEKDRAQQLLAIRFNNKSRRSKRESWFSWGSAATLNNDAAVSPPTSPLSPTSATADHRAVSSLHQQIEDLVSALSQLQKEHSQLNENVTAMKMRELDYETERNKLSKRNATLEKRLKKYKNKLANATAATTPSSLPPPAAASPRQETRLEQLEKDVEFKSFVDSLRLSGDFGALIAGALASNSDDNSATENKSSTRSSVITYRHSQGSSQNDSENDTVATAVDDLPSSSKDSEALHHVTSELVSVKLASFEMGQKYEQLCHKYAEMERQLTASHDEQAELSRQVVELQATIEAMQVEKEQILQEHEDLARENEELEEKNMVAKRTAAELQFEKMAMTKDMEKLEKRTQTLEKEKQEYFMPRGTFSEEVFAAHRILFEDKREPITRRHTLQLNHNEFQTKYIESDLRCRELEKLLAEAKVKLAEYEAATMPLSPRASMQRSSVHMKRTSTASLSMLASRVTSPTSITDPSRRDSAESYASSVTSATSLGSAPNNKRSSMYARLWNSLGPAAPAGATAANNAPRNSVVVKQQI
ncbi:rab-GTPase-TBC domain-containing protein [Fennellomyces sp. T-0311]|nr:rab-GTPase-TBC domain-containing protein [Fennellomyces sp. T-0311]